MRPCFRRLAFALGAPLLAACAERTPVSPVADRSARAAATPQPTSARFSELHYDNVGADAGERVEIEAPLGTNLSTYSLVLYNGANGQSYSTRSLSAGGTGAAITTITTCSDRLLVVVAYGVDGVQNGSPDGMALVNNGTTVVEFLSYEGGMTATNGPANGQAAIDIVGQETANTPAGHSLQRIGTGTAFAAPAANTFGVCEAAGEPTPEPTVTSVEVTPASATITQGGTQQFTAVAKNGASVVSGISFTWTSSGTSTATVNANGLATASATSTGTVTITATPSTGPAGTAMLTVNAAPPVVLAPVRFSELHYDNVDTDVNERVEVEGPANTDLTGWSVVLYNGSGGRAYDTRALSGTLTDACNGRGVIVLAYAQDGIQNGAGQGSPPPDGLALVNAQGEVIEFLSYEGVFTATDGPANGRTSVDIGASETSAPYGRSITRLANGSWQTNTTATFGACNSGGGTALSNSSIAFSGRTAFNDPPLPVGFQDQIFATIRDGNGAVVQSPFMWSVDNPAIASIDQRGVFTALAEGIATFRATTSDGLLSYTYALPTRVGVQSATASYLGNAEFGEPMDGSPADDFIIRRTEYTSSFSNVRNTPNWVSYNLEPSHFGAEDRCDCFTYDPLLPAEFTRYTTADFTGALGINGYAIDRGHLARSADRTASSLDNARSYYFSNIIPQAAEVNQGPWNLMEQFIGSQASGANGREVYVVTGVAGSRGTVKNEGLITIPAQVWKVVVILPRDQGLANVVTGAEPEIIAVIMPNNKDGLNSDWTTYKTTVDAVEALSGYDLLALLPDGIEAQLEAGNRFPTARITGPTSGSEGAALSFSGATSSDPDAGDVLTYSWSFGDGSATVSGANPTYTFRNNGTYTITLTATDPRGAATTTTRVITIANVAPTVTLQPPAAWNAGVSASLRIGFTDPNAKDAPFAVRVNWGDGTAQTTFSSLIVPASPFTRAHTYAAPGQYTITVTVTDRDGGIGTSTITVTVQP